MDLRTYLVDLKPVAQRRLAAEVGTTLSHLRAIAYGQRQASPAVAMQIEIKTHGLIKRAQLRPQDAHLIWPELPPVQPLPGQPLAQGLAA